MLSSSSHSERRPYKQALMLAVVVFATLIASAQGPSSAKKPYALLFGTLWSVDHRPVSGVTIHIRREQDKKPKWTLISDRRGEFAQRVPAGAQEYVVWAELKGKKDSKPVETKVHVDNDERVDFGLHLTE